MINVDDADEDYENDVTINVLYYNQENNHDINPR